MDYIIYKITNKINGKVYIGKHQTTDINDGYMGSGKILKYAIEKYGLENFTKEILYSFLTVFEMNTKEKELVTEDFCLRKDTYNLCIGGHGGFSYINRNKLNRYDHDKIIDREKSKLGSKKLKELYKDPDWKQSQTIKIKNAMKEYYSNHSGTFTGKNHLSTTKKKISESRKGKGIGIENSQHGKCWIYSNQLCKSLKIKSTDLIEYLNNGWTKGRKLHFK